MDPALARTLYDDFCARGLIDPSAPSHEQPKRGLDCMVSEHFRGAPPFELARGDELNSDSQLIPVVSTTIMATFGPLRDEEKAALRLLPGAFTPAAGDAATRARRRAAADEASGAGKRRADADAVLEQPKAKRVARG